MSQIQVSNTSGDNFHLDEIIDPTSNSSSPQSLNRSISQTQSSSQNSSYSHSNCLRSLSLVDSIEFKFDGNISKHALALGDCDNDEKNELVLGTLNGELLIYKDSSGNPQVSTKDLGMVACILVGDILNSGSNFIISLSVEGYLKIFQMYNDVQLDSLNQSENNISVHPTTQTSTNNLRRHHKFSNPTAPTSNVKLPPTIADNEVYSSSTKLTLIHYQQMQSNAMCALLVDFDHDGQNELIVALSDRVVRCYRAVQYSDGVKMVGLYKWEFSDQIASITLHNWLDNNQDDQDSKPIKRKNTILVTQFGGIFAKITARGEKTVENGDNLNSEEIERTVQYCQAIPDIRNPQTSAEILSNIKSGNDNENLMALATHDGTVVLLNVYNHENNCHKVKWRLQLEHPILSLTKFDMNNDGRDELIVCVWSGQVYIIDLDGHFITCHFHEPISSFTAGHFHLNDHQVNCLVYTTFTNSVHLYYDVVRQLSNGDSLGGKNIWRNIATHHPEVNESLNKLIRERFKINDDSSDGQNQKAKIIPKLIRSLLYEIP